MADNGNGALAHSVTRDDYATSPRGGVFHFMLPAGGSAGPDLPPFWSFARDYTLYSTLYRESMWAAAIGLAITKLAAQDFNIDATPLKAKRAQELFLSFDSNKGWVGGLTKHLLAYLLTGNGGPVEIVRATSAAGSKILGLIPLDTFRCIRTGDPDIPIIYRDRQGREHEMQAHQVFILSDMPDQADLWYGVGHCAAERAYGQLIKQEAIEAYVYGKVSGKRVLAFDLVSGVLPQQMEDAKSTAIANSVAKGVTHYMGSVIMAMAGDQAPQHVRINLAELPDGFNRKEETDHTILVYARSLGVPVQDLQPLSGQGLGTGTQTVVLDEAAKGQGLAAWRKQWEHAVNMFVLDDKTTFAFSTFDLRDKERQAKVAIDESAAVKGWVEMGAITAQEARQIGVDRDQLPREFLDVDVTPETSLTDDEKPVEEVEQLPDAALPAPVVVEPSLPAAEKDIARLEYMLQQVRVLQAQHALVVDKASGITPLDNDGLTASIIAGEVTELKAAIDELRNRPDKPTVTPDDIRQISESVAELKARKVVEVKQADPALLQSVAHQAAMQAAALIQAGIESRLNSEDVVSTEIIAHDAAGLAARIRKTLASGELHEYAVERDPATARVRRLVRL